MDHRPVDELASMIEEQDVKGLSTLAGDRAGDEHERAGRQARAARRRSSALSGASRRSDRRRRPSSSDLLEEAFEVLRSLAAQLTSDARRLAFDQIRSSERRSSRTSRRCFTPVYEQR